MLSKNDSGEVLLESTSYTDPESFGSEPLLICDAGVSGCDAPVAPAVVPDPPEPDPPTTDPRTGPPGPNPELQEGPSATANNTGAPATNAPAPGASTPAAKPGKKKQPLYGGTGDKGSCDPNKLVAFLAANPAKAKAWVDALNSDPDLNWDTGQKLTVADIPRFVGELTSLILNVDTRVTNHGFVDNKANPIQSVLQRGTAVLVDKYGVPRVKCYCGNPLLPPKGSTKKAKYKGTKWTGFNPAQVVTVQRSATPITNFEVVMPDGTMSSIPVGITLTVTPGATTTVPATTAAPTTAPATVATVPETAAPTAPVAAGNPFEGSWNWSAATISACEANGASCDWLIVPGGPITYTCSGNTCDSGNGYPITVSGNAMTSSRLVPDDKSWLCDNQPLPTTRSATYTLNPDGTLTGVVRVTADAAPPSCPSPFVGVVTATATR